MEYKCIEILGMILGSMLFSLEIIWFKNHSNNR